MENDCIMMTAILGGKGGKSCTMSRGEPRAERNGKHSSSASSFHTRVTEQIWARTARSDDDDDDDTQQVVLLTGIRHKRGSIIVPSLQCIMDWV